MSRKTKLLVRRTSLTLVLAIVACTENDQSSNRMETLPQRSGLPQVFTVNYPPAYFAERIAGKKVEVVFPAPPGEDPAYWSPTAETIASYQQADLILLNGAGYAGWVDYATLPQSRLMDTSADLADELIPIDDVVTHSHGPAAEHSHQGTAFTTWLDMNLARAQARAVFDGLVRMRPEYEAEFHQGLRELEQDLGELDRRLQEVAERIDKRALLFSHPVYQYLIRRYGLNGRAVHWEPNEMPSEEEWRGIDALLDTHAAAWMVWEAEPLPETVNRLESMGVGSLVFRPCGHRPSRGDFLSVMHENIFALERAFPESAL